MIIEAQGIEKSFGTLKVRKGIDLQVAQGEVLSIMGASGAGKSTLLQILGTLSTPDTGSLRIDGTDVLSLGSKALSQFRNRRIGFVFQFHHLLPEFTALENVMIPAYIGGRSEKEARPEAEKLLQTLGLADRLTHKPSELSGGEQQRVAIARALFTDFLNEDSKASLLFADEPTGNLDSANSEVICRLLRELCDERKHTMVVVTHEPSVAHWADRVITLQDGKILHDQTAAEFAAQNSAKEA